MRTAEKRYRASIDMMARAFRRFRGDADEAVKLESDHPGFLGSLKATPESVATFQKFIDTNRDVIDLFEEAGE